jgi:hypothetical protein
VIGFRAEGVAAFSRKSLSHSLFFIGKSLWRLLKIEGSVLMYIVPPLGPSYIGESAKAYGLKVRCLYGEHVGEQIVNLGNILRTH